MSIANKDGKPVKPGNTVVDCKKSGGASGNSAQPKECTESQPISQSGQKRPAAGRIAILPVRYAVGKKRQRVWSRDPNTRNEWDYCYTKGKLKGDFPPLKMAQYVLRVIREGHIYVYFENVLESFKVTPEGKLTREAPNTRPPGREVKTEEYVLTFPDDAGQVMLAFSGYPWHPNRQWKIRENINKCRDHQMQVFPLILPKRMPFR